MKPIKLFLLLGLTAISFGVCAEPVGTAFSYQGELRQLGEPANGSFDFQFELFDVETEGAALTGPVQLEDVNVQDGVFTVELDFGLEAFDGSQLWLGIGVREGLSDGEFTILIPRQSINASPYALKALTSSCSLSPCVEPGLATITCGTSSLDVSCILNCEAGFVVCSGSCVDLSTDTNNCGGCDNACGISEDCVSGTCVVGCVPDCTGLVCGDDGCGGTCGTCGIGQDCVGGLCVGGCVPDCSGLECGGDGCGGSCGTCEVGDDCIVGTCVPSG